MPLIMGDRGTEYEIQRVGGNDDARRHLSELGFVPGGKCTLISEIQGNVIVNIKNVRVAISRQLAQKIMI